ncbi:hypothetical protein EI94DRAFT_1699707 [Lactarius quietus]|nr:hypothetical protein EI94DRAFT_1699707 [Lactarius quietus]
MTYGGITPMLRGLSVTQTNALLPRPTSAVVFPQEYGNIGGPPPLWDPLLGFNDPSLYGHGSLAATDTTSGSNAGWNTNEFTAIPGWDPASECLTSAYAGGYSRLASPDDTNITPFFLFWCCPKFPQTNPGATEVLNPFA